MVGGRELTRSRDPCSPITDRERERLAALRARRSGAWRAKVRRLVEGENVRPRRQRRDDGDDARRLQLHAGRRERRRSGCDAAIDAGAVMLMLMLVVIGRTRLTRHAVMRVVPRGVVTRFAEPHGGQLGRRARVHRTEMHDRRLADAENEPDGEKCAEDACGEVAGHSVGSYQKLQMDQARRYISRSRRAGRMANAPVLKTGGRKALGVRIPRPPLPRDDRNANFAASRVARVVRLD